ncbi:MAG: hypothetical protein JWO96_129 [Candidatus Saccharibacteria bacterium]|nr:hypothetical protein [Candidatus Saccharibacteria bacterium]
MILLATHPQLSDLHRLIDEIPRYPISAHKLRVVARRKKFAPEVIDFYKLFPGDQVFKNKDDIIARTEVVEIMQTENPPAEDVVHGSED